MSSRGLNVFGHHANFGLYLFAPFYWEDVDLCLCAWRRGRRVEEVPSSVVEHHHRGTIGSAVPEDLVLAAIEKNRHLLLWKHLDEGEVARGVEVEIDKITGDDTMQAEEAEKSSRAAS